MRLILRDMGAGVISQWLRFQVGEWVSRPGVPYSRSGAIGTFGTVFIFKLKAWGSTPLEAKQMAHKFYGGGITIDGAA